MRFLLLALVAAALAAPVAMAGAAPAPRHGAEAAKKKKRAQPCRRGSRRARAACRRRVACESRAKRRYRRRPAARRRAIRRCRRPARKPAPAAAAPPPATSAPAPVIVKPPVAPPVTQPPPLSHRVQVQAREFFFTLSRPEVAAGDVTVELLNRGEDPHDLRLRPPGGGEDIAFPEVPSLGQTTQTVGLSAGSWTLYCSLEGHEALGMRATLRVR